MDSQKCSLLLLVENYYPFVMHINRNYVFTILYFLSTYHNSADCFLLSLSLSLDFCFGLLFLFWIFFSLLTSQALSWVVSSLCRIWKLVKEVFFRSHWKELTWNLCTVRYEGNLWEDWAWSFLQHAFIGVSSSQSISKDRG